MDATSTGIIRVTSNQPNQDDPDASDLIAHLIANNSTIANPELKHVSRDQDETLDPRPSTNGAAYTNPQEDYPAGDPFFTEVNFSGAFSADADEFWITDWTALDLNHHLADPTVAVKEIHDQQVADFIRIYPNPAVIGNSFEIESDLDGPISIQLISQDGRLMSSHRMIHEGTNTISVKGFAHGLYFIKIMTEDGRFYTSKLIIE